MFNTPILFLIFNRPETTFKVIEILQNVKPRYLYVAADGPRVNIESDKKSCVETRDLVLKSINWDCTVNTLFRNENLGCGQAVSEAITWFFTNVEKGIILEDDTVPQLSFFEYSESLLNYFENNDRVMHISGSCYSSSTIEDTYYFTRLPFIWGWATWKRAWLKYEYSFKYTTQLEKRNILSKTFGDSKITNYWYSTLKDFHLTPYSYTWDFQWFLTIWNSGGLVVQPKVNLVVNIGFGKSATHTTNPQNHLNGIQSKELKMSTISHPKDVHNNQTLENENFYFYFLGNIKTNKSNTILNLRNILLLPVRKFKFLSGKILFTTLLNYKKDILKGRESLILKTQIVNSSIGERVLLNPAYQIDDSTICDFTYVAPNSLISFTTIGKFCSIGPNFTCGFGIHPIDRLSTSPMFYSTRKQNGYSLSSMDKFKEREEIRIGNDVFIGMNVTVLDGVTIGDGAVIGAGAVVSKDIPAYAVAVGSPIRILKYRFSDDMIRAMLRIKWWCWDDNKLNEVEKLFSSVEEFIAKYDIIQEN